MLFSQLLGGLGNQLFIISNLYSLSLDRNKNYCITNYTNSCTKRKEETMWLNTIFKNIKKVETRPLEIKARYSEKGMNYQYIPKTSKGLELYGYWQSPKYFNHNKKKIIQMFTNYKKEILEDLYKYFIFKKKTISIHVRRADYLKLQHAHVVQTETYYENSINKICEILNIDKLNNDYTFVIFSDDITWCKESKIFQKLKNKHFMVTNCALYDLYLMSMCDHNIIANSTFSWWGAYLNENENKKVVAPKNWFNINYMKEEKWRDIYTDKMILM